MTLESFCGNKQPKPSKTTSMTQYCQRQSHFKTLVQKNPKRFNTAGNDTQISGAMRFSQIIRYGANSKIYNATVNVSVDSITSNEIILRFAGTYSYVNVVRDDVLIAENVFSRSYVDTNVEGNALYKYTIYSYNANGLVGGISSIEVLTTVVYAKIGLITSTQLRLDFTGAYTYLVLSKDGAIVAPHYTDNSYNDIGLIPNTTYQYYVSSFNDYDMPGSIAAIAGTTSSTMSSSIVPNNYTDVMVIIYITGIYEYINIFRNGQTIASHVPPTLSYMDTGLSPNTIYDYYIESYNRINVIGQTGTPAFQYAHFATLSTLQSSVSQTTDSQVDLVFDGYYNFLLIYRNGIVIQTNYTSNIYLDTGLAPNTIYNYIINSYNVNGVEGTIVKITTNTSTTLTAAFSDIAANQIALQFSGAYNYLTILRNGLSIIQQLYANSYIDTNLAPNTIYNYNISSYSITNQLGATANITTVTLSTLQTYVLSYTISQIVLVFTGAFDNLTIIRNGTTIAQGWTAHTYTDTNLAPNSTYDYVIISYNKNNVAGDIRDVSNTTLSTVGAHITGYTAVENDLAFTGIYDHLSITRNGTLIGDNITGNVYADTGLQANTNYNYRISSFNTANVLGQIVDVSNLTLSTIDAAITYYDDNTVNFAFNGRYGWMDISRNGLSVVKTWTAHYYTDYGLYPNTAYDYIFKSYNDHGIVGQITDISFVSLSTIAVALNSYTNTTISLNFTGIYDHLTILRNGAIIAQNLTDISYTDINLQANTTYDYVIQSYNFINIIGQTSEIIITTTLPDITDYSFRIKPVGGLVPTVDISNTMLIQNNYNVSVVNDVSRGNVFKLNGANYLSITTQSNPSLWVAGGSGVGNLFAYSTDGQNWTKNPAAFFQSCNALAYYNGYWIAGGTTTTTTPKYTLATSQDGISWTPITGSTNKIYSNCYSIATNGKIWVAIGKGTSYNYALAYCNTTDPTNNNNWTSKTSIFTTGYTIKYGNVWVAGGARIVSGGNTYSLGYSYDGINWTSALSSGSIFSICYSVAYNGNIWVAVGSGTTNQFAYSLNGMVWNGIATVPTIFTTCYSVDYGNNMWVAAGTVGAGIGNTLAYSYDGLTWNSVANSKSIFTAAQSVSYTGNTWIASGTGAGNTLAYSYDGISWSGVANSKTLFNISGLSAVRGNTYVNTGTSCTRTFWCKSTQTSSTIFNNLFTSQNWKIAYSGTNLNSIPNSWDLSANQNVLIDPNNEGTNWVFYACTITDSVATLYVNGNLTPVATTVISTTFTGDITEIIFGADMTGSNNITGLMNDMRSYNYVLTPLQIQQVYYSIT